jgi:heme exporter protein C
VTAAYRVLRGAVDDPAMRARYSAVLGVLGALLVPFIHLSVYLFRTMHPMPIVLKPEEPSLPREMLITWVAAVLAFQLFGIALIRARYRLAVARARADEIAHA